MQNQIPQLNDPCKCGHTRFQHDLKHPSFLHYNNACSATILEGEVYEGEGPTYGVTQYGRYCDCIDFEIEPLFWVASHAKER